MTTPTPSGQPTPSARPAVAPIAKALGGVLAALGFTSVVAAFLNWATLSANSLSISVPGVGDHGAGSGDGSITAVLGAVVVVAGLARLLLNAAGAVRLVMPIVALISGLLIVLVATADIESVSNRVGSFGVLETSVAIGLWLTLAAGVGIALVSVAAILKRR